MSESLRILMLEDVPDDVALIEHELRRAGLSFEAYIAQTRDEFFDALRGGSPDIILADYWLPSYSGMEALETVRRERPGTPFIFVSGAIGEERAIASLRGGATDYVLKDHLGRLVPAVRRALQEAGERSARLQAEESLRQAMGSLAEANTTLQTEIQERKEHEEQLEVLHEIDEAVLRGHSREQIGSLLTRRIRQVVTCQGAGLVVFEAESMTGRVLAVDADFHPRVAIGQVLAPDEFRYFEDYWPQRPYRLDDASPDARTAKKLLLLAPDMRSYLAIPLATGSHLAGALFLVGREPGIFTDGHMAAAHQLAASLAVALENARLSEELRASRRQLQSLSRRLVETQEHERRHVAQQLHDNAAQQLAALQMGLGFLERRADLGAEIRKRLDRLQELAVVVLRDLHDLGVDMWPVSLDYLGLVPATTQYIESFKRRTGLDVQLAVVGLDEGRLPPEVELVLYRVVQEALANVSRHARATSVGIVIDRQGEHARAIIEDDGIGFNPADVTGSGRLGLFGIKERVEMAGGKLTVESRPGYGATLYASLPLAGAAGEPAAE